MTYENINIAKHERADCFASFFEEKVRLITKSVTVDHNL